MHLLLRAKAPLRVSFAGGGTDVAPFPRQEGGVVLSATIDRYAYGSLCSRNDGRIRIESADFGMSINFAAYEQPPLDGKLDLIKAAIERLAGDEECGYDLFLRSSAPPGSGLGSSSTVMVALIGLLNERYTLGLDDYEIAQTAYHVERVDLDIKGGLQDQYAATFGGFNLIEFEAERTIVNPLRMPESTIHELEHNMLLCYTGTTRASSQIIEDQTHRVERAEQETLEGLRMQKQLAIEMKNALLRGQLKDFAALLHEAWLQKQRMSPKISTEYIAEIYDRARSVGALGGKVTGAGGGGYILLYCDFERKHKVIEAITAMGAETTEFSFEHRGLTTWRVNQ